MRVEAVRAGDDDPLRADLVEHLDVAAGEHLEEQLVAGPSGGVAGAGLAVAEHREADPGGVQQLRDGLRRADRAVLVGARAADPEQVLDLGGRLHVDADHRDLEVQTLRPVSRLRAGSPHGLPCRSSLVNVPPSSLGNADSMSTW